MAACDDGRPGGGTAGRPARRAPRPPWWVLVAGCAALVGTTGWVALQPLPPSDPSPQLRAVETRLQGEQATLSQLHAQAANWQAQRTRAAQALQQDGLQTGLAGQSGSGAIVSAPTTMTGGS